MKTRPQFQEPAESSAPVAETPQRKRYRAPAILSAEKLEVFAVVCSPPGKGDPGACPSGPINS